MSGDWRGNLSKTKLLLVYSQHNALWSISFVWCVWFCRKLLFQATQISTLLDAKKLRKRTHLAVLYTSCFLVLDLLLCALFFFKSFLACSGLSPFAVDLVGPGAWQAPFKDPKSSHDQNSKSATGSSIPSSVSWFKTWVIRSLHLFRLEHIRMCVIPRISMILEIVLKEYVLGPKNRAQLRSSCRPRHGSRTSAGGGAKWLGATIFAFLLCHLISLV